MTVGLSKTPFPITYRELWLPQHIRDSQLPAFRGDGHTLTLTGAAKRTTADGVHFTGGAASNIVVAAAAGQNAKQDFHMTIRFKLDITFAAGAAANQYLFQKLLAADDYLRVYLKAADGKLYWEQGDGAAGIQFTLTSTTVSWTAGTYYIITVSFTGDATQRLLVNGVVEDTDTQVFRATPNGGDMVVGNSSDGGTDGVVGTISWVVIGVGLAATVALTTDEEWELSQGMPPPTNTKVQYLFTLDEGRGVTAYDRGSAGGNGTLDSACTWAWGQVKQPVLGLSGVVNYGVSSAGVLIKEPVTVVLVVKVKSTYNNLSINSRYLYQFYVDANNHIRLSNEGSTNVLRTLVYGSGTFKSIISATPLVVDSYLVHIVTIDTSGGVKAFIDGSLIGTATGLPPISVAVATAYIGTYSGLVRCDVSKPLWLGAIEGALTAKQVLAYSRWLKDIMNLPTVVAN